MRYRAAIVTGASRGLGLAIARSFLARGLGVVLTSRSRPPELAEHWIEADVADAASVSALFAEAKERVGSIDVLVNNAGIGTAEPFAEIAEETIRRTIDVNLLGPMLCTRAALPDMLAGGRGLIVNIGSDLSRRFNPNMAVYTATKFGLLGFSGSLLREVKDAGVKVTAVLPGVIDTAFGGFAEEGSRGLEDGLPAAELAEMIAALLDQPDNVVVDEITVHPTGQQGF
jgi:3-oxoacyl-[acyl-carrier protein] reductase